MTLSKRYFPNTLTPFLFRRPVNSQKYYEKSGFPADHIEKANLGEIPPAFFAYLFMLLTGVHFETNLPTKKTRGDIDLFLHNTRLSFDGSKSAFKFAQKVLKLGGKYCVISIKNWSLYSVYNFLPQKIEDLSREFEKVDPDHIGLWVLIIPHVPYPLLKKIESYGITVIQTNFQILPAQSEEEKHEQRKVIRHWLRRLIEELQPVLMQYFEANVCYSIYEIDDEYNLTPIANIGYFGLASSSSNKVSNSEMENSSCIS